MVKRTDAAASQADSATTWGMLRATVQAWRADRVPSTGAALAFYIIFSLAPLLLIVISVAGWLMGRAATEGYVLDGLAAVLGEPLAVVIRTMVLSAGDKTSGWWGALLGVAGLLVGATSVFAELQRVLDRIWDGHQAPAASKYWLLLRSRLVSLGLILCLAGLLLLSLLSGVVIDAFGHFWTGALDRWEWLTQMLKAVIGFLFTALTFAAIYRLLPRAAVEWGDVWVGALATALLFSGGKSLIGLYLGSDTAGSPYGAAGSLVLVLLWVYASAQLFLLGAHLTKVYATQRVLLGTRGAIDPAPQANRKERQASVGTS